MRRNSLLLNTAGLVALLLVLVVAVSVAFAGNGGAPRVTTLSGAEEAPVPGDPDGSGFAAIRLNVGQERVCWEISYENISEPRAAHIHTAPAGAPGPVVVALNPISGGCASADSALIQNIIDYPDQYYVNVHTPDFPGGAIRGQLSNPGQSE
ncbi:MAG TPA: CHRD domain-containing protein [Anaerolineae bacterium]|jgi:hypothetical protein|nr:CHRD domain-containing protein [Anaerolineae bacterium]